MVLFWWLQFQLSLSILLCFCCSSLLLGIILFTLRNMILLVSKSIWSHLYTFLCQHVSCFHIFQWSHQTIQLSHSCSSLRQFCSAFAAHMNGSIVTISCSCRSTWDRRGSHAPLAAATKLEHATLKSCSTLSCSKVGACHTKFYRSNRTRNKRGTVSLTRIGY